MSVIQYVALLLAGFGLLFSGLKLDNISLKKLSGRRFRNFMRKLTGNYFLGAFWGLLSGIVFQNISNVSFILIGLVSAEAIRVKRTFPILSWAAVGITFVLFIVSFDIYYPVLVIMGASGIYFGFVKGDARKENILLAIFGVGLMLFGLQLIKISSKAIVDLDFMRDLFSYIGNSYVLAVMLGSVLAVVITSSMTTIILTTAFFQAGLINFEQMMLVCYGTALGDGASTMLLTSSVKGTPKEIAYYRVIETMLQFLLMTSFFAIEKLFNVPLVEHLVLGLNLPAELAPAMVFMLMRLIPTLFISFFLNPIYNYILRICPPTIEEELSKPKYLLDLVNIDTEMALNLTEKEQQRIISRFAEMLRNIHPNGSAKPVAYMILHSANIGLLNEIHAYLRSVLAMSFPENSNERFIQVQTRQNIINNIEDSLFKLIDFLNDPLNTQIYETLRDNQVLDYLHANLVHMGKLASTKSTDEIELFLSYTGDKSFMITNLCKLYQHPESVFYKDHQNQLIDITNLFYSLNLLEIRWVELLKEEISN